MFCKNCGKEINTNEKFCSNCGTHITDEKNQSTNNKKKGFFRIENNITLTSKSKKQTKGKITGIGPGIILIIFITFFCIFINSSTNSTTSTTSISQILNVNDFYKNATQTISKEDLIFKYGQPEKTENWNYSKPDNTKIPLETLSYDNSTYEYIFKDNLLIRININKIIPFNTIKDIYTMFNLTKYESTKEINTGSAIRIYNSSIPDFWCGTNNKNIEWIKITFFNNIF